MNIFKVGIMSDTKLIKAPNALAAAVFYGVAGTNGNTQFMAVVYEQDGKPYKGERTPAMKWQFGAVPTDEELQQLNTNLTKCFFVMDELWPKIKPPSSKRRSSQSSVNARRTGRNHATSAIRYARCSSSS